MICKNCGKEFEGKFCPDCGTRVEEENTQELTSCPKCGTERNDMGKFCVNCGFNFENPSQSAIENIPNSSGSKANKFLSIFAKIYRYLIAGGMLFLGIVSLLCLTAPVITENFLGESVPLCTGFEALSGKSDALSNVVNSSIMLLIMSLLCMVYGGVQLYFAFKKPYIGIKKYVMWGIDGVISIILLILGSVVASEAGAEDLMEGQVGSGFAMCIVMGVFGLIFLVARIFYELKVFKWEDTALNEEQIAIVTKRKQRKPIDKAQVKKLAMRIGIPVLAVAVLIAIVVPSVMWATNIFRVGKVDKINIGDSQEQVIKILGEPYSKTDNKYEYYSDDYVKVMEQIEKLSGKSYGIISLASNWWDEDIDLDDDIDLDEEIGGDGSASKLSQLYKQLKEMTYKYICVTFDSDQKVESVFFDAERCDSEESKKTIESYELVTKEIMRYVAADIVFSTKYNDGSFYKGIAIKDLLISSSMLNLSSSSTIKWNDMWGNDYRCDIGIYNNPQILDKGWGIDLECTEFEIPNGITSIGEYAFCLCNSLTSIEIPSGVTSIGSGAFSYCSSLTSIEIPNSVTSIGDYAFYNCSSLTSIEIPNSVTSISDSAFYGCSSLTSIEIPSGVTSIDFGAFYGCSSLTSVEIPNSVTSIGINVFYGCYSLESIIVDNDNTKYKSENNCIIEKETNILILGCNNSIIPNSVTSISGYAFYGCSGLTSVEIPSSVTSIGLYAFSGCSSLTSVEIPNSVTSIGENAFYHCSSLTIYCEASSKPIGWDRYWNHSNRPVVWGYKG